MASLEKDKFFYDLIMQGRFIINDDATEVLFDNKPKRFYKIYASSKHRLKDGEDYHANYHDGIYHDRKIILLQRLVYMYHTKELIPEGYQITHKDVNKHNNRFDNLLCLSISEHQNYLSTIGYKREITTEESENRRQRAIINNPGTKLTIKEAEYYRCQYHQRKMSINAIMEKTGLQRRAVFNLLTFRSYTFDPITGEFDKELSSCYGDFKKYEKRVSSCTPKKPKEIKIKVQNKDGSESMVKMTDIEPIKVRKKQSIEMVKAMKLPLSYGNVSDLVRYKIEKLWSISKIAKEVCLGERTVKKHIDMYEFFIKIFPNHSLMDYEKRNNVFMKFIAKFEKHFTGESIPNIKPYSFKFLISIKDDLLEEIYNEYRTGSSVYELIGKYKLSESDIKFGIIEYDRYMRPSNVKGLSPTQFHNVYQ